MTVDNNIQKVYISALKHGNVGMDKSYENMPNEYRRIRYRYNALFGSNQLFESTLLLMPKGP